MSHNYEEWKRALKRVLYACEKPVKSRLAAAVDDVQDTCNGRLPTKDVWEQCCQDNINVNELARRLEIRATFWIEVIETVIPDALPEQHEQHWSEAIDIALVMSLPDSERYARLHEITRLNLYIYMYGHTGM
tara:strand:- start:35 stop:430 length:396 start_codon:yes stop_codon:yes gene_type:complete